ncbi:MAG: type II toxin-antitoxin system ParD family antitoxin [Pseudomonadota bacterium]|jgi:antitoxin ParD1/3/4|nr:type II toxin-antitoxin system ParD family antitoxin [Alteromonadaceae bacterium]MDY6925467.1 type II toxin-antitoxin system ParD family antitoxin [Pseudomonadota bacterium]|tara:strand:+ start:218 stop:445 length:228 start_codon:yes stop_codon:yes gene_type:complete
MPRNTSVTIGNHYEAFIAQQLQEGRYGSASEVVRAGLRLLEEHEGRVQQLRAALIEGENSGFVEYNLKEFMDSLD